MALKKRTTKSQGEQLYMLEVMIDKITLNPEQTLDITVEDLIICVRFSDLPEYEINVPIKEIDLKKEAEDFGKSYDFGYGKTCLFSKTPSCLVRAMRWSPLCLEVYQRKATSSTKEDRDLLGTVKISLPACMCNYVTKVQKETKTSSKPCELKDTFDLNDPNSKVLGSVSVVLRLSCFGSSIVKQFSLNEKSFVLEDSPLQKFLCPYLAPEGKNDEQDPKNEDDKSLLKRPDSPPRVTMNDPVFKTLTSAEKLNDPKYRELVYRAYPNEPTCSCLPPNRSMHPMKCRSGCTRSCCMKLRNSNILDTQKEKHVEDTLANTYCVQNPLPMPKENGACDKQTRLRGGGDLEQLYIGPTSIKWADNETDYSGYDEKCYREHRLEGGGEINMSSCSCSGGTVPVPFRSSSSKGGDVIPMFDACKPRMTSTGPKPTCICPGKETPTWPRGAARCMKKPCMGIDCLIRAFDEAQEFVNSIGKVPGLRGLGLMDPSESPYFGRDIDKDYVTQEPSPEPQKKKTQPGTPQKAESTAPRCTGPCSVPVPKPPDDIRTRMPAPFTPATTVGLQIPPRLGIVREAIPVLPEVGSMVGSVKQRKAHEKRDEKGDKHKELDPKSSALMVSEMGPCGEPRCKSRRKKPGDAASVTQSATVISAKGRAGAKKQPKSRRKGKGAKGKGKRRGKRSASRNPSGNPSINPSGGNPSDNLPNNPSSNPLTSPSGKRQKTGNNRRGKTDYRERGGGGRNRPKEITPGPGGDLNPISHPEITVSRRVMRYVYFVGDYYPGIVYGHKNCIDIPMRVPANMGWLWNSMATAGKLKPRIGWKPGAIGRYLYELLQEAKENTLDADDSITSLTRSPERERTRGRTERGKGGTDRGRGGADRGRTRMIRGKPERDRSRNERGRPGTDRGRTRETTDRTRSAPSRGKSSLRRRDDKARGFQTMQQMNMEDEEEDIESPPTLHIHRKDGTYYVTMYPIRQETSGEARLAEPMKPLQFKIVKNKDDASVASSSTASDMEIEFSPPAAVSRYRRKPDVVHVDTQVRQQEILDAVKAQAIKKKDKRKQDVTDTPRTGSGKKRDTKQQDMDTKSAKDKRKDATKREKKTKK